MALGSVYSTAVPLLVAGGGGGDVTVPFMALLPFSFYRLIKWRSSCYSTSCRIPAMTALV